MPKFNVFNYHILELNIDLLVKERFNWERPFQVEDLWNVNWKGVGGPSGVLFIIFLNFFVS